MSFSLNIDTIVLSLSAGMVSRPIRFRRAMNLALAFSIPQTILLIAGWLGGYVVSGFVALFGTWIAFAILCFVGGKMIFEAIREKGKEEDDEERKVSGMSAAAMIWLGFAMGFDAMGVGISYGLLDAGIVLAAIFLTIATIIYSIAGTYIGGRVNVKKVPEFTMQIIAGCIIIAIGIQVLIEYFI